jgi:alkylated DNA repair dioxygenase AlkB
MNDSITNDTPRTRSRGNSVSESNVLDFSQPTSITTPGQYLLSSVESGCCISLFEDVFSAQVCDQLKAGIEGAGTLKQYSTVHRKLQVQLPRLSAWYGPVDYAFSGIVMKAYPVPDSPRLIAAYQNIAENLLKPNKIDCSADSFLINQYRNGRDSCGEHSDNEPEVDLEKPIITLSLGQQRYMLIRDAKNPGNAISIRLKQGSVLVMHGDKFQTKYTHQIPKDNVISAARFSVTYRTCSSSFLTSRNALSTPLSEIALAPVPNLINDVAKDSPPPSLRERRRSSLPGLGAVSERIKTSPLHSPISTGTTGSSFSTCSKTSYQEYSDPLPLSLEAMTEVIDTMKEKTIKTELTRHGKPNSGTLVECRKRLKKAVKESYNSLSNTLSGGRPTSVEPERVTHALQTIEESVIDLQAKISLQHTAIQTLILCQENPEKTPTNTSSDNHDVFKELNLVDKRLEKLEELMSSINEHQENTSQSLEEFKVTTTALKKDTEESKACLQSLKTLPAASSSRKKDKRSSGNQKNSAARAQKPKPKQPKKAKKVLLLHDSQLNDFKEESFSNVFKVEKLKAGSYNDLVNKEHIMREVISKPEIDCYVMELGVNDYRYDSSEATMKKAVENAKTAIDKLLSSSSAKIAVSLPTPTPGPLSERTEQFVSEVTKFVTAKRSLSDYHRRLYTITNTSSFERALSASRSSEDSPNPLKSDKLHVSEYGMKKLCINIKLGLYRAFGLRPPQKQATPEPS